MNLTELKQHANSNFLESQKAVQDKNIKIVFSIARPILVFCASFFIIPKKIRMILSDLIAIMDILIGENENSEVALSISSFDAEKSAGVSTSA